MLALFVAGELSFEFMQFQHYSLKPFQEKLVRVLKIGLERPKTKRLSVLSLVAFLTFMSGLIVATANPLSLIDTGQPKLAESVECLVERSSISVLREFADITLYKTTLAGRSC